MSQFKRFNASENDNWNTSAVYPSGTLTWDPNNGLRLHDGNTGGGVAIGGGGSLTAVDTNIEIKVSDASQDYYTIRQVIDDNSNNYASTELNYEQFSIRTDQQNNGGYEWRFDSNGEFRVPGNINTYDADIEIRAMNAGNAGNITIKTVSHINNIHYSQIQLNQGGINITTDMDVTSGGKSFEFRDTGILVLPSGGNIHNSSGNSVIVPQALGTGDSPEFAGLYINGSNGNEGGQIRLALPENSTNLNGDGIGIDIYENKLRIFENGETTRGVYIDLTAAATDVGTNLLPNQSLNTNSTVTFGNVTVGGNLTVTGNVDGNVATTFEGAWTVPTGNSTQSFTVTASNTYYMWVDCNIPNGILVWNATGTVTNTNVPVVGAQYAWVYDGGGAPIDFTSIPNQFVGTANAIVRSSVAPSATTNRFDFGINNTSGGNVIVRYGWAKIS